MVTKGLSRLMLNSWIAQATASLPLPESPFISTLKSVAAILLSRERSKSIEFCCPFVSQE